MGKYESVGKSVVVGQSFGTANQKRGEMPKREEPFRIYECGPLRKIRGLWHRLYLLVCIDILRLHSKDSSRTPHFQLGLQIGLESSIGDQVGRRLMTRSIALWRSLWNNHQNEKYARKRYLKVRNGCQREWGIHTIWGEIRLDFATSYVDYGHERGSSQLRGWRPLDFNTWRIVGRTLNRRLSRGIRDCKKYTGKLDKHSRRRGKKSSFYYFFCCCY